MFERRLKVLLVLMALPAIAIVLRLIQLQVVDASEYREDIRNHLLLKPVVYSPALRGDIVDHDGQNRLAYDAPAWSICIDYKLIAEDEAFLTKLAMKRYRDLDSDEQMKALGRDIAASWQVISQVSGKSISDLLESFRDRKRSVEAIKQYVQKKRGVQTVVAEETMPQAVARGLDQTQQMQARERLKGYEWVTVVSDQQRLYAGGPSMGHLLGQLGEVGREDVARQNYANMPLGELYEYFSGDEKGTSGLELMGERWLRGRRGRQRKDIYDQVVNDPPRCDPVNGKTMRLTIDLPLQQRIYQILADKVRHCPYSTGGAAVILDIPLREILAIVSVPSYDPNLTAEKWRQLADDELHQPMIFRPLCMRYPPGSTVKPMLLAGALTDGTITAETTVICQQHLFPDQPHKWRCEWAHGKIDPISAVQKSCNIFFYKLGAKMGSKGLAEWMSQFGLGDDTGTGFPRESRGHLPEGNDFGGHAMLGAIGQDQTDATPVQIANMMATLASGVFRPVSLWANDPRPRPARAVVSAQGRPITAEAWREAREGMYQVVNVEHGTMYKYARLTGAGDYILIGKTGSATGRRRRQSYYTVLLKDGTTREEIAYNRLQVQRKYPDANVLDQNRVASVFPPEGIDPTHAWFAGYLTTQQHRLDSSNPGKLNVAIAVIIEFAGHGGVAAGPAAIDMMKAVLERAGERVITTPEDIAMRERALSAMSTPEPFVAEEEPEAPVSTPEATPETQPATQPTTQSAPSSEPAP